MWGILVGCVALTRWWAKRTDRSLIAPRWCPRAHWPTARHPWRKRNGTVGGPLRGSIPTLLNSQPAAAVGRPESGRHGLHHLRRPTLLHTPHFTVDTRHHDVAELLPTFNAFMDTGPIIAAAAAQTSTIKFHYGVIDAVRRAAIGHRAEPADTGPRHQGARVRLLLANGENKQMKPYGSRGREQNEKLSDSLRYGAEVSFAQPIP